MAGLGLSQCGLRLFNGSLKNKKESKMPKVLISDKMSPLAEECFKARGIEVDVKTGMAPDELIA